VALKVQAVGKKQEGEGGKIIVDGKFPPGVVKQHAMGYGAIENTRLSLEKELIFQSQPRQERSRLGVRKADRRIRRRIG